MANALKVALNRRIDIQDYLICSTVVAVLLFVPLRGTFLLGYVVAIVNSTILLALNRLTIHRNHLLALAAIAGFSLIGARSAGTTAMAIATQIVGIGVMSIYYLSILTNFQVTPTRWMELYVRAAFALTVLALIIWPFVTRATGDPRLRAIFSEPSYYIYVTLPAVGYCINRYIFQRRYGWESLIFVVSYALADSTLGFLGLLLTALLAYAPRLKGWQMITGSVLLPLLVAALYFASFNFRYRANDFAKAIWEQDLSGSGSSTFAFLSNIYVTSQSFLAHPLTGIGIGGYANAYDKYIGDIGGTGATFKYMLSLDLNRDDANSMFLRIAAELGMPGVLALLAFLVFCARVRGQPYTIIRNAILPYLVIRITRLGAYFTVELYFFVGLYVLNYLTYRSSRTTGAPIEALKSDLAGQPS